MLEQYGWANLESQKNKRCQIVPSDLQQYKETKVIDRRGSSSHQVRQSQLLARIGNQSIVQLSHQ